MIGFAGVGGFGNPYEESGIMEDPAIRVNKKTTCFIRTNICILILTEAYFLSVVIGVRDGNCFGRFGNSLTTPFELSFVIISTSISVSTI